MKELSYCVLLPLMVFLIAAAYNERLRARLLSVRAIASLESRLQGENDRLYWVAFALCMAAGIGVRCWRFGQLPYGVNQDGAMAGVEAFFQLRDGTDHNGVSWPTYFEAWGFSQMSTLYSYVLIPFIRVLGLNRFSLRLPMLLASLISLPILWDLARRIAGKGYALLALFVLAGNPWHVLLSRWALEANLFPPVLLVGVYLLYLGKDRRWALYLSMVFFGLTPYAYGVACFSTPVLLAGMALYYLVKGRVRVVDVIVCALIFGGIAAPYFATMLINMMGWPTIHLGPITIPYFENSLRSNEIGLVQWNPYLVMISNFRAFFGLFLVSDFQDCYNAIDWASLMYRFTPPLILFGAYRLWRDRRDLARRGGQDFSADGGMLILMWLFAAAFNSMTIAGVANRNNVLLFPLVLILAFALFKMGSRLRVALCAAVAVFTLSFGMLCVTYFADETYQNTVGTYFHDGLQQALTDTWDQTLDKTYLSITGGNARDKRMLSQLMFARSIDYSALSGASELDGPDGKPSGRYFDEFYAFADFDEFVPDQNERAVYIIMERDKDKFDQEAFSITDYGQYAVAYPRLLAQ